MDLSKANREHKDIWDISYIKTRMRMMRFHAAKIGVPFVITSEDVKRVLDEQDWRCFYTGVKFIDDADGRYVWSIDRKDPTGGYTPDNIVACCNVINTQKGRMPSDEFIAERWNIGEMNRRITGSKDPLTHLDVWAAIIIPHSRIYLANPPARGFSGKAYIPPIQR